MANIKKEIETLRAKIARLEEQQQREEAKTQTLTAIQTLIDKALKEEGLSYEAYVRDNYSQIKRIISKIDNEKGLPDKARKTTQKRRSNKKRGRASQTKVSIKIPAGRYGNLPADPKATFQVKEKGPRPKLLKAYAVEVGLEAFLSQCRLD